METKEPEGSKPAGAEPKGVEPESTEPAGAEPMEPGGTPGAKKRLEEKIDDVADKFAKTMSDGVKRIESVLEDIKNRPDMPRGKIKGFFTSSTGGTVLLIVGIVWLLFTLGWFEWKGFPIILIAAGIYLMVRYKSD